MKKIILYIFLLVYNFYSSQTDTENYIQIRTYLEPVTASSTTAKQVHTVQYFDGLGRPKQSVAVKATAKGNDLVTIIPYDGFGRQVDSWLPVSMVSKDGEIQSLDPAGVVSYYTTAQNSTTKDFSLRDAKPFSHKALESSPLDRIQQQFQTGNDWSLKPVSFGYETNVDSEVYKYVTTTSWSNNATSSVLKLAQATDTNSSNNCYKANQLYKNIVTDEDGNVTVEFKNGQGQTLLIRKNDGQLNADTYYVYNEYNQLAFVIPPQAVGSLFPLPTGAADTSVLSNLCYQYRYDGRNRLVEKKLPGKGWEYMVYDNQDRLVMTQDANMGADNQWLFTKYDQFGRVAYTGMYISEKTYDSAGRNYEQGEVNKAGSNNVARTTGGPAYGGGVILFYDNLPANNYPNTITELLSINYYDTYPAASPAAPATILTQNLLQQNAQTSNISTKSLPTASFVKNIDTTAWTKTYIWYDTKGRQIGTNSVNHLGGYTNTRSLLDFSGAVQEAYTYHKRTSVSTETAIKESFVYDGQNRLLVHKHQVNSQPEEILTQNTYNEIGQLKNKKVGGINLNSPRQSIDYAYNIRGWMSGINLDSSGNFQTGKLFNYKINYNNTLQGLANPNPDFSTAIKPRYNGNIAEVLWQKDGDTHINRYGYVYDGLNRLLAGLYQSDLTQTSKDHSERLTYDLNGNIITLKRSAYFMGTAADLIDDLTYKDYVGNKFTSITDDSHDSNGYEVGGIPINYDKNGNMTDMQDKGIVDITYNYLNLPKQFTITPDSNTTTLIKTGYRADGVKIKKENITTIVGIRGDFTTVNTTDYLDGFQYLENRKSSDGGGSQGLVGELETEVAMEREAFSPESRAAIAPPGGGGTENSILQFVPTAEGFYDFLENKYIYQYKDHLGNTRVSYAWNATTTSIDVLDRNDYYPFGMNILDPLAGASFGQGNYKNYKYNGKELQETGMYDYGARFYMPDIARWGVIDPLTETSRRWSPYTYANNNPVFFTDPTGMITDGCPGGKCPDGLSDIKTLPNGESEAQIQGVVLQGKKKETNPYLKGDCYLCTDKGFAQYHGGQTRSEFNFQRQASLNRGPEPGGGGVTMMSGDVLGLSDFAGILFSSWYDELEPDEQRGAIFLGGVALILTRNTKIAGAEAKVIMGAEKGIFVVDEAGVAVSTSQSRMIQGFENAGFSKTAATQTTENGTIFNVPTANGPVNVRAMQGNSKNGMRSVFSNSNGDYRKIGGGIFNGPVSKIERIVGSHLKQTK